jgi:hypothetical protein
MGGIVLQVYGFIFVFRGQLLAVTDSKNVSYGMRITDGITQSQPAGRSLIADSNCNQPMRDQKFGTRDSGGINNQICLI